MSPKTGAISRAEPPRSQLVWGLFLMALGSAFLLDSLGFWDFDSRDLWRQWPFVLIAIGLARFLTSVRKDGRPGGLWLVFVGLLGLAHTYRILRFQDSWPLFLVAVGAEIAFQALHLPRRVDETGARHDD